MAGEADPVEPTLPPNMRPVPIRSIRALTAADSRGLVSMPWGLAAVSDAMRSIDIYFVKGDRGCVGLRGVYVVETASRVAVAVLSKDSTSDQDACASVLVTGRARVTLGAALGRRALVHAEVSRYWRATLPRT